MPELRSLLEDEFGASDVSTLLNSGNAVFYKHHSPRTIDADLAELVSQRFGFSIDVTCRTRKQLLTARERDPLGKLGEDDAKYVIAFMPERPRAAALRAVLEADYPAGEACACVGREFYAFSPKGVSESAALKALGRAQAARFTTVRNMRTIEKLLGAMS